MFRASLAVAWVAASVAACASSGPRPLSAAAFESSWYRAALGTEPTSVVVMRGPLVAPLTAACLGVPRAVAEGSPQIELVATRREPDESVCLVRPGNVRVGGATVPELQQASALRDGVAAGLDANDRATFYSLRDGTLIVTTGGSRSRVRQLLQFDQDAPTPLLPLGPDESMRSYTTHDGSERPGAPGPRPPWSVETVTSDGARIEQQHWASEEDARRAAKARDGAHRFDLDVMVKAARAGAPHPN